MKNKTAIVAFRTRQDIKDKVNNILAKRGLDTSTVLNMVMQNIALSGRSPVSLDRDIGSKLVKIIRNVQKENENQKKVFSSAKEAVAFIRSI